MTNPEARQIAEPLDDTNVAQCVKNDVVQIVGRTYVGNFADIEAEVKAAHDARPGKVIEKSGSLYTRDGKHIENRWFDDIALYAFRYALGRQSYATGICADHLIENWDNIKPHTKERICEEIQDSINTNHFGMGCDRQNWERVIARAALTDNGGATV